MIVTINGADGSGKSTVLEIICSSLEEEIQHHHSRPGIILSKRNVKKQRRYVSNPTGVPQLSPFLQMLKISLFFAEYQLFAIWHKITSAEKIVILERSLVDLCAHPARYGLSRKFTDVFRPFLIEWYSDLNICLVGDERVIASRKSELTEGEIMELNKGYINILSQANDKLLLIDTSKDTETKTAEKLIFHLRKIHE